MKVDSKSVIKELQSSDHKVIMITGDSVYTAVDVAKRLSIISKQEAKAKSFIPSFPRKIRKQESENHRQ